MKNRVVYLSVALLFSCQMASAQSNVTLFGNVDLNIRNIKNTGQSTFTGMGSQGNLASHLGFKGEEDLGGGLKATFHLELGFLPDTGASVGQQFNIGFFNRQSTVGLKGSFGEVKLGRDWTASYNSIWIYDSSFGFGVADTTHVAHNTGQSTYFWTNNAISYTLPGNLGGFYGQLMYAPGENSVNGRYAGGRFGYASGPFDVSVSAGNQAVAGGSFKLANIGAAYDFNVVKLMALYSEEKVIDAMERRYVGAVNVPLGADYAFVTWTRSTVSNYVGASGASQVGAGYVHTLSKRTAIYGAAAFLDNKGTGQLSVNGLGTAGASVPTAGGNSRGFEVGLRHSF